MKEVRDAVDPHHILQSISALIEQCWRAVQAKRQEHINVILLHGAIGFYSVFDVQLKSSQSSR